MRVTREKAEAYSRTPEFHALLHELIIIGPDYLYNSRAKAIGKIIDENGGMGLMLGAHEVVQERHGRIAGQALERAWGGIGDWMA